jgi:signal transduction histidine kinase
VDAEYFKHALFQLLDNSIFFSHTGGTIYIHAHTTTTHVIIRIEDEGIGIADDDLEYLFERFWRKDKSHTAAGFGLGLSLAQKIIELHEGEIEVDSELNQGSIFTIAIPI